jgi:hypothetical protein
MPMKRAEISLAMLVSIAVLAIGIVGCDDQSTSTQSAAAARAARNSAEESFQLIVDTFRRGVEDIPIGFVVRQESGHSMMVGKNEVSHELIRPTKEGEPYRAVITVASRSRYSLKRDSVPEDDSQDKADNQSSGIDSSDESGDSGTEIIDSDLVSSQDSNNQTRRSNAGSTETMIARRPDEGERNYDLVYDKGRWKLVTKLDPETERSIRNAFDQALKTQK